MRSKACARFSRSARLSGNIHEHIHLHHEGAREGLSPRPRSSSRTSGCRFSTAPRSACSALNGAGKTHAAARSWRATTQSSSAKRALADRLSRRLPARRSRSSIRPRTCSATSRKASPTIKALLTRFDEINAKLRRGAVARGDGQGHRGAGARSRTRSRRPTRGTSTRGSSSRWTRCACRRPTPTSRRSRAASAAASRSAGCCCSRPTCCCSTSRRTISTPSRSPGSSASCKEYPGTVVAITHDRYFLDNVAGWILELDRGRGIPWEGNYSSLARAEAEPARAWKRRPRAKRQRTLRARARVDPHVAARAAGQGQGAPQRLRGPAQRGRRREEDRAVEIYIPPGPRLGDIVVEARDLTKGLRRLAADGRHRTSRCRAAASSASSAPTAPARRRCSG